VLEPRKIRTSGVRDAAHNRNRLSRRTSETIAFAGGVTLGARAAHILFRNSKAKQMTKVFVTYL
jgi:hypothetical protein